MQTRGSRTSYAVALFFLLPFFFACSQYQRLLQSDDHELKYKRALEYYYEEDYGRAIGLLSDIIPVYRGTAEAERINHYFALAHYESGQYTLASHYLKSFVSAFPHSEHAEEFLFLSAYCQYLESPRYSLDQTNTRQAIRELQSFVNRYPRSERVADANQLIDELREKLEKKKFNTGRMYLDISDYLAAATTFETMVQDYPDTKYREEAMFLTVKAHYQYAYNSIPQRQKERYQNVLTAYNAFQRRYPESEYKDRAKTMTENARAAIARLEEMEVRQQQQEQQASETNQVIDNH